MVCCNYDLGQYKRVAVETGVRHLNLDVHSEAKWREYNRFFFSFLKDIQLHLTCKNNMKDEWNQTLKIWVEGEVEMV